MSGKTLIPLVIIFGLIISTVVFVLNFNFKSENNLQEASAGTATTSVTVTNTPPNWTASSTEQTESSVANPTNAGDTVTWIGTGTDPNAQDYWLLICSTSAAAVANNSNPPECAGGIANRWARSATTTSGSQASCSTTTNAGFSEQNDWYGFICDGDSANAKCNLVYTQGYGSGVSPFVVNHRPTFTVFVDNSPKEPGQSVTWTSTSSDPDSYGGQDTVKLFVCKSNDFTGTACGAGGTYCSSSLVTADPTCNFTLETPKQDKDYTAYGYVIDEHNFAVSGGQQGVDSVLTVANVAPTVASSTISLMDWDESGNLTPTTTEGETGGFKVQFTIADNNSCQNASAGDEIVLGWINVYRSEVTKDGCDTAGEYNANYCYSDAYATWNPSCTASSTTCSGSADSDIIWTCTFPLQYHSEPTVGSNATDSTWYDQTWMASAQASDDNSATSTLTESQTGNEMDELLAYELNTNSISYGSFEPGQGNDTTEKPTVIKATGNVGLDEDLSGVNMCTTYPSCPGGATNTIFINQQHYSASTTLAWASGTAASSTAIEFEINSPKTTVTAAAATSTTGWGIQIPSEITLSGSYTGLNTIVAIKGEAQDW